MVLYSTVLIIGAGETGLCMGAKLKSEHNFHDFAIYDRHSEVGGTWWVNTYPGAACDVPAIVYSYSFARNPDWTVFYPQGPELHAYFVKVCEDFGLRPHITFSTEVESATWDDDRKIWSVRLRKLAVAEWEVRLGKGTAETGKGGNVKISGMVGDTWTHECKVLFSAVGGLVRPNLPEFEGMKDFKGKIMHSAEWDHTVSLEGKDVVLLGNGCTGSQIVPAIEPKVKSLTQIVHSSHWTVPRPEFPGVKTETYEKWAPIIFRYIPGAQAFTRLFVFIGMEAGWLGFRDDERGAKLRKAGEARSIKYVKKHAPEKYWDLLIPKFPFGYKRRVFDNVYMDTLNSSKIHLTKDSIVKLSANAVHTAAGAEYKADVIVLATGFKMDKWLSPLEIIGRNGERLEDHWDKMGGPSAYNTTSNSGFPNFFMLIGPHTVTGHTSVIFTSELTSMYALKIAKPVLLGEVSEVEVKKEAEVEYSQWIQKTLTKTVWKPENKNTGVWYIRKDGWNSITYPASQFHFLYHCTFPNYKDWIIKKTSRGVWMTRLRRLLVFVFLFGLGALGIIARNQGLTASNITGRTMSALGSVLNQAATYVKSKTA